MGSAYQLQQFHDAIPVDVLFGAHREQLPGVTAHRSENIVALSSAGPSGEETLETPDHPQKTSEHEMRGIHVEDLAAREQLTFGLTEDVDLFAPDKWTGLT